VVVADPAETEFNLIEEGSEFYGHSGAKR